MKVTNKKLLIPLFFILIIVVIVVYRPTVTVYPPPKIPKWALVGSTSHNVLYLTLYPYKEYMIPLKNWDTLYTNDLTIYAMSFNPTKTEAKIQFFFYQEIETENGTRMINIHTINYTMPIVKGDFTKLEVILPTHTEPYKCIILADGKPILFFVHHSHPHYVYVPRKYTFGNLMTERLVYIFTTLITVFLALGVSHKVTSKLIVVPQVDVWGAIYCVTIIVGLTLWGAYQLIYLFGIVNVLWSYPIIGVTAFVFGFFLTKQPRKTLYCYKPEDETLEAELKTFHVVFHQNEMYLADLSLREWLQHKVRKVVLEPPNEEDKVKWKVKIKNSENILIYYKEIKKEEKKLKIKCSELHVWDVEKAKADVKRVHNIAKEKRRLTRQLNELSARYEVDVDRRARAIFKAYQRIREKFLRFEEMPKKEFEEKLEE